MFLAPFHFLCNNGLVIVFVIISVLSMVFCFSTFMHIIKFDLPLLTGLGS